MSSSLAPQANALAAAENEPPPPLPSTADARLQAQVDAKEHRQVAAAAADVKKGHDVLEELEIILELNSIEAKPLARGGFGSVYRARFVAGHHCLVITACMVWWWKTEVSAGRCTLVLTD